MRCNASHYYLTSIERDLDDTCVLLIMRIFVVVCDTNYLRLLFAIGALVFDEGPLTVFLLTFII